MNKEAVPKQALEQKRFQEHYWSDRHNDIEEWMITWIYRDVVDDLNKRDVY